MGYQLHGEIPVSYGNSYILLVVDYVSKWVEAKAIKTNDAKTIVEFVKSNLQVWDAEGADQPKSSRPKSSRPKSSRPKSSRPKSSRP
ncbi:hypothetical protein CR513_60461, partial [Mucuna pruriens]